MSTAARDALIKELCKALKVPTLYRTHEGIAREANDEGWAYEDYLLQLLEAEVNARRESSAARRLHEARFPDVKTLDQIDWKALQGVSRPKILELSSCEYLEKAEDVIIAGPIGTGKTHLAIALGVEATRRRKRVFYTRAADLVRDLLLNHPDDLASDPGAWLPWSYEETLAAVGALPDPVWPKTANAV